MPVMVAEVTITSTAGDVTPSRVAETLAVPTTSPVATPVEPSIVNRGVGAQVTWLVIFNVVASEYVPVTVRETASPTLIVEERGVTEILTSLADAGAKFVLALLPPLPPQEDKKTNIRINAIRFRISLNPSLPIDDFQSLNHKHPKDEHFHELRKILLPSSILQTNHSSLQD
jgi:hypothetical protein